MKENKLDKIKSLKKRNFHIHLTGALKPDDLRKIAKYANVNLSLYEPLENHMRFDNPLIWGVAKELTSNKQGLFEAIKAVLNSEIEDNVNYIEITLNPAGMLRRGMSIKDITSSIKKALLYGSKKGITCMIKLGVNRRDGPESIKPVKDVFLKLPIKSRVCIDLNGNERKYPNLPFIKPFKQLSSEGVPVCIHAGEFFGLENSVLEALEMSPKRITHAIAATKYPDILNKIYKQGVIIETCMTSNKKTGAIKSFKDYPIKKFLEYKIPVVIGSDDPALFKTNMTKEFKLLSKQISSKTLLKINNKKLEN